MINYILLTIVLTLIPLTFNSYNNNNINFTSTITENNIVEMSNYQEIDEEESNIVVRLKNPKTKEVNLIDLENYIIGVVAAEMPASFEIEALKAQAVAARTYALVKMNARKDKDYDLEDSTNDQAYITIEEMKSRWNNTFDKYYEKVASAVNETKHRVVKYNEQIVPTYYFAISNGQTQNVQSVFGSNEAYLVGVESKWDNETIKSFSSTKNFTLSEFKNKFSVKDSKLNITNIKRNNANYVTTLMINGIKYTGNEMKKKLSLRSSDFEIKISNDKVIITTYGYGHGVGMSQYGANGMAKEGYDYEEILKYYYQNIDISQI